MAKSLSLTLISFPFFHPRTLKTSRLLLSSKLNLVNKAFSISSSCPFSTTATRYPLQYELIISRPVRTPLPRLQRRRFPQPNRVIPNNSNEPNEPTPEMGLEDWVDKKLSEREPNQSGFENLGEMDKSKRKYYRKRRKRMYGSDSDEERPQEEKFVELKQEVVDFHRLHKREEELYFYDAFAYPWEKEKHYKMVYQLEKKYFPDQCLDKAFVEPGESKEMKKQRMGKSGEKKDEVFDEGDEKGLVFFDDEVKGEKDKREMGLVKGVTEKKVEEFFKCLKKVPNKSGEVDSGEPYMVTRKSELPPRWDGPYGTVVLVNKPKG